MITGTELLEALPVAIYTTDADGRITFYNRAAAELWGKVMSLGAPLAPSSNCASGPPFARRDTRRGRPKLPARVVAMHNPIYWSADHTLCGRLRATAAWVGTIFAGARFGPVRQE